MIRTISLLMILAAAAPMPAEQVMIPMRDGVRLSAFIFKPKGDGPWPVLYEQRYGNLGSSGVRKRAEQLASHGYVIVEENFRGTLQSEGVFAGYRPLGWGEQQ